MIPYSMLKRAFTAVEVLLVVVIIGVLTALVLPSIREAHLESLAKAETENLRTIQGAKLAWMKDHPGEELPVVVVDAKAALLPYLAYGWPESPWGLEYEGINDVNTPVSSVVNGDPTYEPQKGESLVSNGLNDLGLSKNVYLVAPDVAGTLSTWTGGNFTFVTPPPTSSGNWTLSLSVSPSEGGTTDGAGVYADNTIAHFSATPADATWRFLEWQEDLITKNQKDTIGGPSNRTGKAIMERITHTLWVNSNPALGGVVHPNSAVSYVHGAVASASAIANAGYKFTGWGGDTGGGTPSVSASGGNLTGLVMTQNRVVMANFECISTCDLTVNVNPENAATPEGSGSYESGTKARYSYHSMNASYKFTRWSGAVTGNQTSGDINMTGSKTVTANFDPIDSDPRDGTLTVNINPPWVATPVGSTTARLDTILDYSWTNKVSPDYLFIGWSGDVSPFASGRKAYKVVLDRDKTVTANFIKLSVAPDSSEVLHRSSGNFLVTFDLPKLDNIINGKLVMKDVFEDGLYRGGQISSSPTIPGQSVSWSAVPDIGTWTANYSPGNYTVFVPFFIDDVGPKLSSVTLSNSEDSAIATCSVTGLSSSTLNIEVQPRGAAEVIGAGTYAPDTEVTYSWKNKLPNHEFLGWHKDMGWHIFNGQYAPIGIKLLATGSQETSGTIIMNGYRTLYARFMEIQAGADSSTKMLNKSGNFTVTLSLNVEGASTGLREMVDDLPLGTHLSGNVTMTPKLGSLTVSGNQVKWNGELRDAKNQRSVTITIPYVMDTLGHKTNIPRLGNATDSITVEGVASDKVNLEVLTSPSVAATPEGSGEFKLGLAKAASWTQKKTDYSFISWSGDVGEVNGVVKDGVVSPLSVVMDSSKTVTANFMQIKQYPDLSTIPLNGNGTIHIMVLNNSNFGGDIILKEALPSGAITTDHTWSNGGLKYEGMSIDNNKVVLMWKGFLPAFSSVYLDVSYTMLTAGAKIFTATVDNAKDTKAAYRGTSACTVGTTPPAKVTLTVLSNPIGVTCYAGSEQSGSVLQVPRDSTLSYAYGPKPSNYSFIGWSGDSTSTESAGTLLMDTNKTVIANFIEIYKTSTVEETQVGQDGMFFIDLINQTSLSSGVQTMTDIFPDGISIVGNPYMVSGPGNVTVSGKTITWTGNLPSNSKSRIGIQFKMDTVNPGITNLATLLPNAYSEATVVGVEAPTPKMATINLTAANNTSGSKVINGKTYGKTYGKAIGSGSMSVVPASGNVTYSVMAPDTFGSSTTAFQAPVGSHLVVTRSISIPVNVAMLSRLQTEFNSSYTDFTYTPGNRWGFISTRELRQDYLVGINGLDLYAGFEFLQQIEPGYDVVGYYNSKVFDDNWSGLVDWAMGVSLDLSLGILPVESAPQSDYGTKVIFKSDLFAVSESNKYFSYEIKAKHGKGKNAASCTAYAAANLPDGLVLRSLPCYADRKPGSTKVVILGYRNVLMGRVKTPGVYLVELEAWTPNTNAVAQDYNTGHATLMLTINDQSLDPNYVPPSADISPDNTPGAKDGQLPNMWWARGMDNTFSYSDGSNHTYPLKEDWTTCSLKSSISPDDMGYSQNPLFEEYVTGSLSLTWLNGLLGGVTPEEIFQEDPSGGVYPADIVTETGVSFKSVQNILKANITNYLGSVSYSEEGAVLRSFSVTAGRSKLAGHTWTAYSIATTYVKDVDIFATSENIVYLDVATGKFLGVFPYVVNDVPRVGDYCAYGKIVGMADGTSDYISITKFNKSGSVSYPAITSPIVVDWNHDGIPNLLSKGDWKANPDRTFVVQAMRKFDMDGTGELYWEWVGPEDGLLVYNPSHKSVMPVTGKDLFGYVTFGKQWFHGYQPLSQLDKDNNGMLMGTELDDISIWIDANSDAIVQEGEMMPCREKGVVSINTTCKTDELGNAWAPGSVMLDTGFHKRALSTWDWIPLGGLKEIVMSSEDPIWDHISAYRVNKGIFDGGSIGFANSDGVIQAYVTMPPNLTSTPYPVTVEDNNKAKWEFPVRYKGTVLNSLFNCSFEGLKIKGIVTIDGKQSDFSGELVGGQPFMNFFWKAGRYVPMVPQNVPSNP